MHLITSDRLTKRNGQMSNTIRKKGGHQWWLSKKRKNEYYEEKDLVGYKYYSRHKTYDDYVKWQHRDKKVDGDIKKCFKEASNRNRRSILRRENHKILIDPEYDYLTPCEKEWEDPWGWW